MAGGFQGGTDHGVKQPGKEYGTYADLPGGNWTSRKRTDIPQAAINEVELARVFREAIGKFRRGQEKHGPYLPESDPRVMVQEMRNEILDAIVYLGMGLMRLDEKLEEVLEWERGLRSTSD